MLLLSWHYIPVVLTGTCPAKELGHAVQYSKGTEDIVYITTSDNQSLLQFHINHLTREVDNPRTIPRHGEYQKFGRLYGQGHMYCEAGKVFKCMDDLQKSIHTLKHLAGLANKIHDPL